MLFKIKTEFNNDLTFFGSDDLQIGDHVIIEISQSKFVGQILNTIDKQTEKPEIIVRKASDEDLKHHNANLEKAKTDLEIAKELAEKHKLNMKIVAGQWAIDDSKFMIVFSSDERVDFRTYVKEIAGKLRTRIELKQIGNRDEVKQIGGIGSCGRACCCSNGCCKKRFPQVTPKMCRNQNLNMANGKCNGICGKLRCCIAFENENYEKDNDENVG
jgi:cell fate regulator YaaT (PSP1 superfamily)